MVSPILFSSYSELNDGPPQVLPPELTQGLDLSHVVKSLRGYS